MFFLFLVTILAVVRFGETQYGQGSTSTSSAFASASAGFGGIGGRPYGVNHGYGSGYGYSPQSHYPPITHIPGRLNPFIPYRSSSSVDSAGNILQSTYRNPLIPQTYIYQYLQKYTSPNLPYFPPATQTPSTIPASYYSAPYYEVVETYKFYDSSKVSRKNKTQSELNVDTRTGINGINTTTNGSQESTNNEESLKEETTAKSEPMLQLTYLGYLPQLFRSVQQGKSSEEARNRIPFYIVDYDQTSGRQRSSLASPTVYVSPTRNILPSTGIYGGYPSPLTTGEVFPYGLSSVSPVVHPVASPYRSSSSYNPSSYRYSTADDNPGYHLIDVKPVARDNTRFYKGASSQRSAQPTMPTMPMINTIAGPMGGPIGGSIRGSMVGPMGGSIGGPIISPIRGSIRGPVGGMLGPASTGLNSNAQSQAGYYKGQENVNKFENEKINTGYETQLPGGHAYSSYQSNKELAVQKFDDRGDEDFNSGYNSHSYGNPGL